MDPTPEQSSVEFSEALEERAWELRYATMLTRKAPLTRILTICLVAVHVVVWLATPYLLGGRFDDIAALAIVGAKIDGFIAAGEWWRLATPMFLHANVLHLVMNLMALIYLGRIVENVVGSAGFLIVFALGGIVATVFSYLFMDALSVGASGAIMALLGVAAYYGLANRKRIPRRLKRFMVVMPMVWIGLQFVVSLLVPNVDHAAHCGGLVAGLAIAPLLRDQILMRPSRLPHGVHRGLWLVSALVCVFSMGIIGWRATGRSLTIPNAVIQNTDRQMVIPRGWLHDMDQKPVGLPVEARGPYGERLWAVPATLMGRELDVFLAQLSNESWIQSQSRQKLTRMREFGDVLGRIRACLRGGASCEQRNTSQDQGGQLYEIRSAPSSPDRIFVLANAANTTYYHIWVYRKLAPRYGSLFRALIGQKRKHQGALPVRKVSCVDESDVGSRLDGLKDRLCDGLKEAETFFRFDAEDRGAYDMAVRVVNSCGPTACYVSVNAKVSRRNEEGLRIRYSVSRAVEIDGINTPPAIQTLVPVVGRPLLLWHSGQTAPLDLLKQWLASSEIDNREVALNLIIDRHLRELGPSAIPLLADPDPEVRQRAIFAVGLFRIESAVGKLYELVSSDDSVKAFAAIHAIADIGGNEARKALRMIAKETSDSAIRDAALAGLSEE